MKGETRLSLGRLTALWVREWWEIRRNRSILWTFAALAAVFLLLPLGIVFALPWFLGPEVLEDPNFQKVMSLSAEAMPRLAELGPSQQIQLFLLRQFQVLFLILPIVGTMSIATYSIIGEKTSRTLEPLLATPVTTLELVLAKSLAAALPAVVTTWAVYLVFAALVALLGEPPLAALTFDTAAWLTMALITPLAALLALGLGVLISSRARDPRGAQQIGGLLVLPLVVWFILQSTGLMLLGVPFVLLTAALLAVADAFVLALAVAWFEREQILTRWR